MTLAQRWQQFRSGIRLSDFQAVSIASLTVLSRLAVWLGRTEAPNFNEFGDIGRNVINGFGYTYFWGNDGIVQAGVVHEAGVPVPGSYMPPGFTYAVMAFQKLTGSDAAAATVIRSVNVLLAIVSLALLLHITARVSPSRRTSVIAGLVFALMPAFVYQTTLITSANFYFTLLLGLIVLAERWRRRLDMRTAIAFGGLGGAYTLFRAEGLLVVAFTGLLLLIVAREIPIEVRARIVIVAAATCVAIVAPWLIRTSLAVGRPVVTVATSGQENFWIGNHVGATGSQKERREPSYLTERVRALRPTKTYELDRASAYWRDAKAFVRNHPIAFIKGLVTRMSLILFGDRFDDRYNAILVGIPGLVVIGLATWSLATRRGPETFASVAVLSATVLPLLVFFVLERYRSQVAVAALPWAASKADSLLGRWWADS